MVAGPVPEEKLATCDSCVMCRPAVSTGPARVAYFDDTTKCCTFQPKLPNFLVGAMLEDESAAFAPGRASIEKRIDEREGVTPLALERPWTGRWVWMSTGWEEKAV